MSNVELFRLGDIPQALLDEALALIKPYATAIGWVGQHIGSGTFVRINNRFGILTAAHVWECVFSGRREHPEIQLVVANGAHSYSVSVDYLMPHLGITRTSDPWGPDIEFIELPPATVDRVEVAKSFYNLSLAPAKQFALATADDGFAAITGFAEEQSKVSPLAGQNEALLLELRGGFVSAIESRVKKGDYDYLETIGDRQSVPTLPKSYGGVSGAGLWRMSLNKKPGAPITQAKVDDIFAMAGVAFYEESRGDGMMTLRYHGPETIYRLLPRLVPPK